MAERLGRVHRWLDLVDEATSGALARPLRAALTSVGATIGIGALVATIGLAQTASAQILTRFDELQATEVVAYPADQAVDEAARVEPVRPLPLGADRRLLRLNGVRAAGSAARLEVGEITGALADRTSSAPSSIVAASPGLLAAARGTVREGRWFDAFHDRTAALVAVLGPAAATRLGIGRIDHQPTVVIDGSAFVVIGILDDVARETELLNAVIVPEGTAAARFGLMGPERIVVDTDVGATVLIASQLPLALHPTDPRAVGVRAPPDLAGLRSGAETDVSTLALLMAGVTLAVGTLGIANSTLIAVFERAGEIGLRRALGGTRTAVAGQFLLESTLLGLLGGLVGMSAGLLVVVGAAAVQDWTPVLDLRVSAGGPVLGAGAGLTAGIYPAVRASRVEPAAAVRRSMG